MNLLDRRDAPGKWVNVDDLCLGGKLLLDFEPGTRVRVKGKLFEIERVSLVPPELGLVPVCGERK